jgi:hypothetical protein
MKQFITMEKVEDSIQYRSLQAGDHRFIALWCLFDPLQEPNQLLKWLYDKERTVDGNEFFDIRKKDGVIALYDRSEWLEGEEYRSVFPDENKRFDMSYKNFEEILLRWEKLRVSMPEIILLVIHEDNHVSLETDPTIIKEYQDAGYAFDIDKTA